VSATVARLRETLSSPRGVILAHLVVQLALHALALAFVIPAAATLLGTDALFAAVGAYYLWLPVPAAAFVLDATRIPDDADWHPRTWYYLAGSLLVIVGVITTWEYLAKRYARAPSG
jgi:hypothetical protein